MMKSGDDAKMTYLFRSQLAPHMACSKNDVLTPQKNLCLEDLQFFKNILAKSGPAQGRIVIKLYRLLNKLIPISLNYIFHDMDCYEMQNHFPDGAYWSKASLFIAANTAYSLNHSWSYLQKELQTCKDPDSFGQTLPLFNEDVSVKFEDDFEVCQEVLDHTATGINDWLLMQVPVFPSMMLQWWIAANISLLKIEKVVADFHHLRFPKQMEKAVHGLFAVVEKARRYLGCGIQSLLLSKDGTRVENIKRYEILTSVVSSVIHSFERNPKVLECVNALKRMCWNQSSLTRNVAVRPCHLYFEKRTMCKGHKSEHQFEPSFWTNVPSDLFTKYQVCGKSVCFGCLNCKESIEKHKLNEIEEAKKMYPHLSLKDVKQFISENIIWKGRFFLAYDVAILEHAGDAEIFKQFLIYFKNKDFAERSSFLCKGDRGLIHDTLVLTAELEQAKCEAAITQRLTALTGLNSLAVDCEGPDVTLDEIEKTFKNIESKPPWKREGFLFDSQKQVDKARNLYEKNVPCIGVNLSVFEYRIKMMVIKIVQKIYDPEKKEETPEVDPSWHFVQYLLPCFLASYYDLEEDKRVSLQARNFYLNFIDQLLKRYEQGVKDTSNYFGQETVCFLKWRFETVCMDLEGYLYSDLEETRSNSSDETDIFEPANDKDEPSLITSTMKSNCFDVLTDFLCNTKHQKLPGLQHLRDQMYILSNNLQSSVWKLTQTPPGFSWKWGAELKAMSTLCRILATEVFKRHGLKDKIDYDHTNHLLGAIFKAYAKSEKSMMIRMMPGYTKKDTTWSDFQARVEAESLKLSEQQQLALALYMCLSSSGLKADETHDENIISQTIDAVERAYYQIKAGKHVRFQQKLSTWQRDEQGVNLAQVSYKYALEVAPLCYSVVTCRLTKDMKIQMKEPGEVTFCPVRHCRWCGQVETEQKELFVCQFCKDIPEYPDVNLFCSLDCEEKTLDQKHREEHTEMIQLQLGLKDVAQCMENLSLSPNCLDQLEPKVDDFIAKDRELLKIGIDDILRGAVRPGSCGKCHNKEPKEELFLICKGSCGLQFHIQCIGILDSDNVLRVSLNPETWACEKCSKTRSLCVAVTSNGNLNHL